MRKSDEITLLDTLIQQTPRNSYLRSLLDHIKPQFESDIRSDFSTLPDIAALDREALALTERNWQLQGLNRKVEQEIQQQRETQKHMYQRVQRMKDDVMSAGAALETALNNFTKP